MQKSQLSKSFGHSQVRPSSQVDPVPSAGEREKCQILAKKGFLVARNTTTEMVLLVYSKEFQLGVLLHLGEPSAQVAGSMDGHDQAFTKTAIAMILSEFETLGVSRSDLNAYVIGGSATETAPAASKSCLQRMLWNHGLSLTGCDLGGRQVRSIWMDVETGRTIIRSEAMSKSSFSGGASISVAS
jgi:chemotaxis receptor (MCP) glutamine deamidase CheD